MEAIYPTNTWLFTDGHDLSSYVIRSVCIERIKFGPLEEEQSRSYSFV